MKSQKAFSLAGGRWRMWVPVYVSTIFIFLFVNYDYDCFVSISCLRLVPVYI